MEDNLTDRAMAVGEHYSEFLRFMVDLRKNWESSEESGREEFQKVKAEFEQVDAYMKKNGRGEDPK